MLQRWLTRVLIGVAAVYVVYLVAANVLLATSLPSSWIAARQDNVRVEWDSAFTWFPGRVVVRGLSVISRDTHVEVEILADESESAIGLFELFDQTLSLSGGETRGLTFRARKTRPLGELCKQPPHALPAIGDLAAPPGFDHERACLDQEETAMPKSGPPDPSRLWRIVLEDVYALGIREVWIEDERFIGHADGRATFAFFPTQSLAIEESSLAIHEGGLLRRGRVLARGLRAELRIWLDDVSLEGDPLEQIASALSAELELGAELDSLALVDRYLGADWIRLGRSRGRLTANLAVDRGRFAPGSRFELAGEKLSASAFEQVATGSGKIVFQVTRDGDHNLADLAFSLGRFSLRRARDKKPHLVGRDLAIAVRAKDPLLSSPLKDPDLSIRLGSAHVPDVSFYNGYIPRETDANLISGEARAAAELVVKRGRHVERGHVRVSANDVRIDYRGRDYYSAIELDIPIARADLARMRFGVEDGRVSIHEKSGWWAELRFESAELELPRSERAGAGPVYFDTKVLASLADMRPIVEVFDRERRIPGIVRAYDSRGALGSFELAIAPSGFALDRFQLKAGPLEVKATLIDRDGHERGALLVGLHGIRVAVEIEGEKTSLSVLSPSDAYAKRANRIRLEDPEKKGDDIVR